MRVDVLEDETGVQIMLIGAVGTDNVGEVAPVTYKPLRVVYLQAVYRDRPVLDAQPVNRVGEEIFFETV